MYLLNGKVITIELLGNQKHIYVDYEDTEIVAIFRLKVEVKLNSKIKLLLNFDRHFQK